jgi:hypothetical protein|nr:MAG TPA: tail protein [Caudoviricetes sp.]
MSNRERLLKNLHKIFRKDLYLNNVLGAGGNRLDSIERKVEALEKEIFFDTMSDVGIAIMEKELDYTTNSSSLGGKRQEIEARWKTAGKCDLKLLQAIADTWRTGEVAILFTEAVIKISFISVVGIPYDVENLKAAIDEAKPAHLPIEYIFTYRTWGMLPPKTWGYYKNYTWDEVRSKEGI